MAGDESQRQSYRDQFTVAYVHNPRAQDAAFAVVAEQLLLPDPIVAEVPHVLQSYYEVARHQVAGALRAPSRSAPRAWSTLHSFIAPLSSTTCTGWTSPMHTW